MSYQKSTSGKHIRKVATATGITAPDGSPVLAVYVTTAELGLNGMSAQAVSTTISEGEPTTYVEVQASETVLTADGRSVIPVIDIAGTLGGGASSLNNLVMGTNVETRYYGYVNAIENDFRFGDVTLSRPSATVIPNANRDVEFWPTVPLQGSDTSVSYTLSNPESGTITVVLGATGRDATLAVVNGTLTSGSVASGTLVITPDNTQPVQTGTQLRFAPGASNIIPRLASARMTSQLGNAYLASHATHIAALCNSGSVLRTTHRTSVETNEGVTCNDISEAAALLGAGRVLNAANRNTLTTCDWGSRDGIPIEADLALAANNDMVLWRPLPINADDDLIDAYGDKIAEHINSTGKKVAVSIGPECWNGAYAAFHQLRFEGIQRELPGIDGRSTSVYTASISGTTMTVTAFTRGSPIAVGDVISAAGVANSPSATVITALGTGTGATGTYTVSNSQTISSRQFKGGGGYQGERLAELTCKYFSRIMARLTAAGAPQSKLVRTFCWQNDAGGSTAAALLDYAPPGYSALKNYVDAYAVAIYLESGLSTATTDVDGSIDGCLDNADWVIDTKFASIVPAVTSRVNDRGAALVTWVYECSATSLYINDATTRDAVQNGPRTKGLFMHCLARLNAVAPAGTQVAIYSLTHTVYGNQDFGVLHYSGQDPTTSEKYKAYAAFKLNQRKLIPLKMVLSDTPVDTANGTVIGTIKWRTPGSTLTMLTPGLGFVDSSLQIVQVEVTDNSLLVAGSLNVQVTETDARDLVGTLTSSKSITIVGAGYRYFRLRTTANAGYFAPGVAVAEFEAATSAAGSNAFLGKTATATQEGFGSVAGDALDANGSTFWQSNFDTLPQDLIVDMGASSAGWITPYEFRITARTGGGQATQAPGDFTIAGSTDGSSYTTLLTRTGQTYTGAETKTFVV